MVQKKQVGNDADGFDDEFVAIFDNFLEVVL